MNKRSSALRVAPLALSALMILATVVAICVLLRESILATLLIPPCILASVQFWRMLQRFNQLELGRSQWDAKLARDGGWNSIVGPPHDFLTPRPKWLGLGKDYESDQNPK